MNRLSHSTGRRTRIRPRATVLGGAALGLVAGAAVYGIVSSGPVTASSPAPFKPALVSATPAAAAVAAPCARGQKLEHGVCIVHVHRTVVIAAPRSGPSLTSGSNLSSASSLRSASNLGRGPSSAGARPAAVSSRASEPAHEGTEHAEDPAEHETHAAGQPESDH